MMKKLFLLSLFIFSLHACGYKREYKHFVSLPDAINRGNNVSKPLLLCLVDSTTYKFQTGIYYNFLQENFVCYIVRNPMKTVLGKIIHPSEYPVYIILEKDSITSIFYNEKMESLLEQKEQANWKSNLLNSEYNNEDLNYLNVILKLHMYLDDKKNGKFAIGLNYLDSLIGKRNKFYEKYLLAQLYKVMDIEKADEMYSDLWINSTTAELKDYPEEFIDIMKGKDHMIFVERKDIQFDYTEYDFGNIAPYEEVSCIFYFTNNSNQRFIIHNVITTCGCTVPFWNRKPINPKARDSIAVKFKTDHQGINQKTIIVEGNCKQKIALKIKALVCN